MKKSSVKSLASVMMKSGSKKKPKKASAKQWAGGGY